MALVPRIKNREEINQLKAELLKLKGLRYQCYWCDRALRYYKPGDVPAGESLPNDAATMDHILNLHDGGTNDPSNIEWACWGCNQTRAAKAKLTRAIRFLAEQGLKIGSIVHVNEKDFKGIGVIVKEGKRGKVRRNGAAIFYRVLLLSKVTGRFFNCRYCNNSANCRYCSACIGAFNLTPLTLGEMQSYTEVRGYNMDIKIDPMWLAWHSRRVQRHPDDTSFQILHEYYLQAPYPDKRSTASNESDRQNDHAGTNYDPENRLNPSRDGDAELPQCDEDQSAYGCDNHNSDGELRDAVA